MGNLIGSIRALNTKNPSVDPAQKSVRVAYLMSRFPKITETFILYEILALEELGIPVEIFPLLRSRQRVTHAEAARLVQRARFQPFFSLAILFANLHFMCREPRAYFGVLLEVLRGTWRSANFLIGAVGIFPKAVRFAFESQRLGVTHVHAHFATHPTVAALIIHRLTGIPFSFTAHGSDLHVDRRMLDRKVEASRFTVTISNFNRNVILEECGEHVRHKIHVVHCGVDPQVFTPVPRTGEQESLQILCVASYEEVKGHRYLIEACSHLKKHGVRFDLHLVGEGPLRQQVEAQVEESGLRAHIHVHGAQPRTEVVRRMSEAHVMCLPSVPTRQGKREGIPVVLMEAMASGLPVVSSRLSGIPELVEDGVSGLLVEPRDSAGLAAAFQELQRDPGLAFRLGRAGRLHIEEQFNLYRSARQLAELFVGPQVLGHSEESLTTALSSASGTSAAIR